VGSKYKNACMISEVLCCTKLGRQGAGTDGAVSPFPSCPVWDQQFETSDEDLSKASADWAGYVEVTL
jgi:hypothetical protein